MTNKKCEVDVQYGKDNNKQLHFYCEYCGKEMGYEEDRMCPVRNKKGTWQDEWNKKFFEFQEMGCIKDSDEMIPFIEDLLKKNIEHCSEISCAECNSKLAKKILVDILAKAESISSTKEIRHIIKDYLLKL